MPWFLLDWMHPSVQNLLSILKVQG
jgi:hypothetical protein